ncbi:MAG: hypothetical protein HC915_16285 [Anaerolineae bacterium]|nr:hypothetical protein [Anaerolineae bacterium]
MENPQKHDDARHSEESLKHNLSISSPDGDIAPAVTVYKSEMPYPTFRRRVYAYTGWKLLIWVLSPQVILLLVLGILSRSVVFIFWGFLDQVLALPITFSSDAGCAISLLKSKLTKHKTAVKSSILIMTARAPYNSLSIGQLLN